MDLVQKNFFCQYHKEEAPMSAYLWNMVSEWTIHVRSWEVEIHILDNRIADILWNLRRLRSPGCSMLHPLLSIWKRRSWLTAPFLLLTFEINGIGNCLLNTNTTFLCATNGGAMEGYLRVPTIRAHASLRRDDVEDDLRMVKSLSHGVFLGFAKKRSSLPFNWMQ